MVGIGTIRSCNSWWTIDQPVFAASEIWNLVTLLNEHGRDPMQFVSVAGMSFDQLLDPSRRLAMRQAADLLSAGFRAGFDNFALLFGRRLHLSTFGVPGFAVLSSRTMIQALETIARVGTLLNLKFPLTLKDPAKLSICYVEQPGICPKAQRQIFAIDVAKLATFHRDLLGPNCNTGRVLWDGEDVRLEQAIECILKPGSQTSVEPFTVSFELDPEIARRPLLQAQADTHRRAMADCERVIDGLRSKANLKSVIKAQLRRLEVHVPSFAELSMQLGMSERTLRRRLEKSGTSFSRILDEMREELAAELLVQQGETTEAIAERLGYSDAANFRHAFKRWTGEAPSHFRSRARTSIAGRSAESPPELVS